MFCYLNKINKFAFKYRYLLYNILDNGLLIARNDITLENYVVTQFNY